MSWEALTDGLLDQGWAMRDGWLDDDILNALRQEALMEYEEGEFNPALIGKGVEKQRVHEIRSDRVRWLERAHATPAQAAYWKGLDDLRAHLSDFFRIHLERSEIHFAVYPVGAFYAPHLDQFRGQSDRIFSVITYLNPSWKPGHGGELRIHHPQGGFTDIAPVHGRILCFRSDAVLHEVLEARELRVSLTGWMRRDPLIY